MKKNILFFLVILGTMTMVSLAFITVEKFLPDGWYYVPSTAKLIAIILTVIWSGVVTITIWRFSTAIKKRRKHRVAKGIITVSTSIICICVVSFLLFNCLGYCAKHQGKVEQYDEHLALYVKNTFVRPQFREPCYRYKENWLLMRKLTDEELSSAILKYGNPKDYYGNCN